MRFPAHLLKASTVRSEPLMAALAAVAVGMFVGTWVLGPAMTHDTETSPPVAQERISFQEMVSRPDPMPYRAPTPTFDSSGPPHYAAAAKEKAQAELGGDIADADSFDRPRESRGYDSRSYRRSYYQPFDRHRVY
jgi:hypothetical protein